MKGSIEMKVLILTGKFGMGHYSVSSSLSQQITSRFPYAIIETKDIFNYTVPKYSDTIYKAFSLLINKSPSMYNQFYKMTENSKMSNRPPFLSYFLYKLKELIDEVKPDVIISTLPFCSQLVSRYKIKYYSAIPLVTCITDISSHSEWINECTNCYIVGSNSLKQKLIQKGVSPKRIFVNGIPVKEEFKIHNPIKNTKEKKVLIMGGGLGLLPKESYFYKRLNSMKNVKFTVITGKNQEMYDMLVGKYENIDVIGYTDKVYKYMLESDLIISKPGGITLFESIFSETPMLVFTPFLAQEKANTAFIINNNIGKVIGKTTAEWLFEIEKTLNDENTLNQLRKNIITLKSQLDTTVVEKVLSNFTPVQRGVFAS